MMKIIKESSEPEKLVISKGLECFEVTPESNYGIRVANDRKIKRLYFRDGWETPQDIIDYYNKYFNTTPDDFIIDIKESNTTTIKESETNEGLNNHIQELKDMHDVMVSMNNEDAYYRWIVNGVPDEPSEDDFEYIASDSDEFNRIKKFFLKLYKLYHADGIVSPSSRGEAYSSSIDAELGLEPIQIYR